MNQRGIFTDFKYICTVYSSFLNISLFPVFVCNNDFIIYEKVQFKFSLEKLCFFAEDIN